jgi:hypothetical protein
MSRLRLKHNHKCAAVEARLGDAVVPLPGRYFACSRYHLPSPMTIVEVLRMQAGHPLELTRSRLGFQRDILFAAASLRIPDYPYGHADAPFCPIEGEGFT